MPDLRLKSPLLYEHRESDCFQKWLLKLILFSSPFVV